MLLGTTLGVPCTPAATYTYTGGDGQYTTASNWSGNVVPNTANGDTAILSSTGANVTYTPGGDLVIKNGGSLQINSGSFIQAGGNNYYQLNGNGSILINGGTFNQGTASSNPFNVSGTGNNFTVSSGTANISSSFNINVGLAFNQTGGTVNVTGNETDFNGGTSTLSGGILNTKLITGVNGPAGNTFNISGGALTLTGNAYRGIYGGGTTHYINFTENSTGSIDFTMNTQNTEATIRDFLRNNIIEFNNTVYNSTTDSLFQVTSDNAGGFILSLANVAVPEPATFAAGGLLALLAAPTVARRLRRRSA